MKLIFFSYFHSVRTLILPFEFQVHRAVQILRDKQELAEAQKELAKLQTIRKESSPNSDEHASSSLTEPAKHEDAPQLPNNQLALVPSHPQAVQLQQHLTLPQPQLSQQPVQQDQYTVNQPTTYYQVNQAPAQQLPPGYHYVQVAPAQPHVPPVQPAPPQQQQAPPQQAPPPQVSQVVNPMPQRPAPIPQFSHQWSPQQQPNPNPNPQQFTSQGMQPLQAATLSQPIPPSGAPQRPHTPPGYSPYPPHQPSNSIPETYAVSMPTPTPYSTGPQPGMNRSDMVPVGYGSQGNPRPPIQNQGSFMAAPQMSKGGYTNAPPYMQGNLPGYSSGPYNYPPSNVSGVHVGSQQLPRNHPYGEFVEKAVGMGYPREQVTSVAVKMTESGQPMDFNSMLDRLNGVSSPSPRAWSG
jgi:UBA-like domain (DUF1421)